MKKANALQNRLCTSEGASLRWGTTLRIERWKLDVKMAIKGMGNESADKYHLSKTIDIALCTDKAKSIQVSRLHAKRKTTEYAPYSSPPNSELLTADKHTIICEQFRVADLVRRSLTNLSARSNSGCGFVKSMKLLIYLRLMHKFNRFGLRQSTH